LYEYCPPIEFADFNDGQIHAYWYDRCNDGPTGWVDATPATLQVTQGSELFISSWQQTLVAPGDNPKGSHFLRCRRELSAIHVSNKGKLHIGYVGSSGGWYQADVQLYGGPKQPNGVSYEGDRNFGKGHFYKG